MLKGMELRNESLGKKKLNRYSRYVAYMTTLIEVKPSTFEEYAHQ